MRVLDLYYTTFYGPSGIDSQPFHTRLRLLKNRAIAGVLVTAVACSLAGALTHAGIAQRDVRAVRHQAVRACDAAWETCRSATGFPVREGDGTCVWRHPDAFTDDMSFGKGDGKGAWISCAWKDEPGEEAADDESSCGLAWSVCLREATR